MRLYQIGTIVGPWVNFTPPIRGGTFRLYPEQEDIASSDDDISEASTLNECSTVEDTPHTAPSGSCRRRKDEVVSHRSPTDRAVVDTFVAKLIQGEIDDNLRDYPSLDADTQNAIDVKFKALHQRVKDEGYYNCDFSQYAKEISRYAILLACFIFTLRAGWYLVSAAFLGVFWVRDQISAYETLLTRISIK